MKTGTYKLAYFILLILLLWILMTGVFHFIMEDIFWLLGGSFPFLLRALLTLLFIDGPFLLLISLVSCIYYAVRARLFPLWFVCVGLNPSLFPGIYSGVGAKVKLMKLTE